MFASKVTRILTVYLAFLILAGCTPNPMVIKYDDAKDAYFISGDVGPVAYDNLVDILKKNQGHPVNIFVNSNGGKVAGIERAMDAIRAHGQVSWKVRSKCYSACALLGLSSSKIDGTLYFHSVYSSYKDVTYKLVARNNGIRTRLISYGYDEHLVDQLFNSINIYTKLKFNNGVLEEMR